MLAEVVSGRCLIVAVRNLSGPPPRVNAQTLLLTRASCIGKKRDQSMGWKLHMQQYPAWNPLPNCHFKQVTGAPILQVLHRWCQVRPNMQPLKKCDCTGSRQSNARRSKKEKRKLTLFAKRAFTDCPTETLANGLLDCVESLLVNLYIVSVASCKRPDSDDQGKKWGKTAASVPTIERELATDL